MGTNEDLEPGILIFPRISLMIADQIIETSSPTEHTEDTEGFLTADFADNADMGIGTGTQNPNLRIPNPALSALCGLLQKFRVRSVTQNSFLRVLCGLL